MIRKAAAGILVPILVYELYASIDYLLFSYRNCSADLLLFNLMPLPGAMVGFSWILLLVWLSIGLLLTFWLDESHRRPARLIALAVGLLFIGSIVNADLRCKEISACGEEFADQNDIIVLTAASRLDKSACLKLEPMVEKCRDRTDRSFVDRPTCEKMISNLIGYKMAGIDINPCVRSHSDCHSNANEFFSASLSNELSSAKSQCLQRYSDVSAQRVCEAYIAEWERSGQKP